MFRGNQKQAVLLAEAYRATRQRSRTSPQITDCERHAQCTDLGRRGTHQVQRVAAGVHGYAGGGRYRAGSRQHPVSTISTLP